MKALFYSKPGKVTLKYCSKLEITAPGDAVVRVTHTTICGTDLHILKGDVPTATPGRILGHEGVGVIDSIGTSVTLFKKRRSCADFLCQRLRHLFLLPQADVFALHPRRLDPRQHDRRHTGRIRAHALCRQSLYHLSKAADEEALVMLSDILPTGFKCGVLNDKVAPGSTVGIVGARPFDLAALLPC